MSHLVAKLTEGQPIRAARLRHFAKRDSGNLTIFALCLFLLMAMMGGIAVDLMRYEGTRTALQNTLDRATLASASLSQQLDPEDVVTDYFAKSGLSRYLKSVTVEEGLNYREVVADARAETDPFFMHMIGIDEMEAPGHSKAEQRMTNVEVVLVLDVSGSMATVSSNGLTRLRNLQNAASEFVDTVLSNDTEDRISIALVPFNGQVNLGATLRQRYNEQNVHGVAHVNCLDLPSVVYNQTGLSTQLAIPMTAHADTFTPSYLVASYVDRLDTDYATPVPGNRWCPPSTTNTVMMPTQNILALQNKINSLTAIGATSINAGMKWGMTLIDPGSQGVLSHFVDIGQVPQTFEGRPFEYTDPETMKIVVLMTDGEHFAEERVADKYKSGITGANGTNAIYKSPNDGNYSIRFTTGRPGISGSREYWVPHRSEWRSLPWTNSSDTGASALQPITFEQLWSEVRLQWVVWQLYARALGTNNSQRSAQYNTWLANLRQQTPVNTMNNQLQQMCTMARDNGVTVYGIAFEAPVGGQAQISQCATSSAHYFNAAGLQIRTAFRAIASNISHLRLTQ
ncbi:pilus assembly protein TadG-related protein [Tabrizicola sp.]|uniref:pilus assembly protein n=1 Tax=Tabrizicola sp. TaxID=2005166 RepID=UPI003D2AAF97